MKIPLHTPLALALLIALLPVRFHLPEKVAIEPHQEANIQFPPVQEVAPPPKTEVLTVKALPSTAKIANVMKKIAWCESHNRQFDETGAVLRGVVNPLDTGYFQLNKKYHLADSIRLGMDIETLEGNKAYGQHLYETQGTTPWNWSKPCWSDPNRVWTERDAELWSK